MSQLQSASKAAADSSQDDNQKSLSKLQVVYFISAAIVIDKTPMVVFWSHVKKLL